MMKNKNFSKKKLRGFTLIELLIVIAIITILAAGVIVGINPARHFRNARNATRWSHMNTISSAVYSYAVENGGNFPTNCIGDVGNATTIEVVLYGEVATTGTWCFGDDKVVPKYLRVPPQDPFQGEYYQIEFIANKEGIKITTTADEASSTVILIQ